MPRSMTGFGRGEYFAEGIRVTCEIKTVNSKFLDVFTKLPQSFRFFETRVKPILEEESITRGKADIAFEFELENGSNVKIDADETLAREYLNAMNSLAEKIGDGTAFTLRDVIGKPDVLRASNAEISDSLFALCAEKALRNAVSELLVMREKEGEKLKRDFEERLSKINEISSEVDTLSEEAKSGYFKRLEARLRKVLEEEDITPDEGRILTECAIFADKIAVDEETVRLRAHIEAFKTLLYEGGAVGRRLDFLTQEMNREANTIGSKCQDSSIAHRVVVLKNEIEKIREQVQNIE